ncbi:hypothetical protein PHLGIDRAFT_19541 [Phlebiopsis gigantea 11061_1 CR5-6]|uniref:C2H2-type domain-containing protein n=1 Tax=Phlebiopsis gigantea (strain 11061_1 CR5-6) TaxID=745531 RepID=A0A0C3S6B5_PHLG1|nr:hypothetical protein PHLGIDRAFT_19541 [Phlebiopsis gigantea 11061_1 CR5-6]
MCGMCFSKPSGLQVHVNSHTGYKPFQCEEPGCSKRFSSNFNLQRHKGRLHANKT